MKAPRHVRYEAFFGHRYSGHSRQALQALSLRGSCRFQPKATGTLFWALGPRSSNSSFHNFPFSQHNPKVTLTLPQWVTSLNPALHSKGLRVFLRLDTKFSNTLKPGTILDFAKDPTISMQTCARLAWNRPRR